MTRLLSPFDRLDAGGELGSRAWQDFSFEILPPGRWWDKLPRRAPYLRRRRAPPPASRSDLAREEADALVSLLAAVRGAGAAHLDRYRRHADGEPRLRQRGRCAGRGLAG